MEEELSSLRKQLGEKNGELSQQVATLRVHIQTMEQTEHELRGALSDADRELRSLRVELRRAQGGTPLVTDVVIPNPVEKTIHGLERRVDRLKGNVIAQMEEVSKTSADKADFKAKCRELQGELDDALRAKTRLELDKADLERRLTRRIDDLEAKLSSKSKEAKDRDTAVTKASRIKAHMEDKEIEVSVLQDQIEQLKQEIGFAKTKYDSVTDKLRSELGEERAKVERLELKLHVLESELDGERKKTSAANASKKQVEEQLRKTKEAQVQTEKETDKLMSRVAKLEKNLRDMERAAMKI
jgi:chromosome segregation ATPase